MRNLIIYLSINFFCIFFCSIFLNTKMSQEKFLDRSELATLWININLKVSSFSLPFCVTTSYIWSKTVDRFKCSSSYKLRNVFSSVIGLVCHAFEKSSTLSSISQLKNPINVSLEIFYTPSSNDQRNITDHNFAKSTF